MYQNWADVKRHASAFADEYHSAPRASCVKTGEAGERGAGRVDGDGDAWFRSRVVIRGGSGRPIAYSSYVRFDLLLIAPSQPLPPHRRHRSSRRHRRLNTQRPRHPNPLPIHLHPQHPRAHLLRNQRHAQPHRPKPRDEDGIGP